MSEIRVVCTKIAAIQGETPYIIAIAIMYESPTVITELKDGSK